MDNKLYKYLEQMTAFEKDVLTEDDPNGSCAASHRGAIKAYERVQKYLLDNDEEEKIASCGHPERFWKVEVNQDAWCVLCAVEKLAVEFYVLAMKIEGTSIQPS